MSLSEAKQLSTSVFVRRSWVRIVGDTLDDFYTEVKSESVALEISLLGREQVLFWKVIWYLPLAIYERVKGLECS